MLFWDWTSSRYQPHLFIDGRINLGSGPALLQPHDECAHAVDDRPRGVLRPPPADRGSIIAQHPGGCGHVIAADNATNTGDAPTLDEGSRPLHADHAEPPSRLRPCGPRSTPPGSPAGTGRVLRAFGRFADSVEVLRDDVVLNLAFSFPADAELHLAGADDPAFAVLKVQYANVRGGAPHGMPPDRGMELELELETGDTW